MNRFLMDLMRNNRNYQNIFIVLCSAIIALPAMENPAHNIVPSTLKTLAIAGAQTAFYSPDGQYLIIDAHNGVGKTMAVRKTQDYQAGINVPLPPHCFITTISPDNYAITADTQNPLVRWNIHNGQHEILSELTRDATYARYDKSGQRLVFSRYGQIFLLDLKSNKIVKEIRDTDAWRATAAWNPINDNEMAISVLKLNSCNTRWGLWDLVTDKVRVLATIPPRMTSLMQFNNNGDTLVCGALEQFVHCDTKTAALTYYALNGQKRDHPFRPHGNSLYSASVVPEMGTQLFAGSTNNRVAYSDMDDIGQSFVFNPEPKNTTNIISALAIAPSGKQMAVGTVNNANESVVKILNIGSKKIE